MTQTTKKQTDRIRITALDGHRGVLKYTNPDWGTIAYFIPKSEFIKNSKFTDAELKYNCIYFLVGYEASDNNTTIEKMYVGQAGIRSSRESVIKRISEHLNNINESYYGKWDYIVVATNNTDDWKATQITSLEHIFWNIIHEKGSEFNHKPTNDKGDDLNQYREIVTHVKKYVNAMNFYMFSGNIDDIDKQTEKEIQRIISEKEDRPIDLSNGTSRIPDITTPSSVVNKMINMLPAELFDDPDKVFLDMACKGGEYLEAIMKRCQASEIHKSHFKDMPDPKLAQALHILNKQLYGISITPNSYNLASKRLSGAPNIVLDNSFVYMLKQIITNKGLKNTELQDKLNELIEKEFNRKMKISVVIGNPPYQEDTDGGGNKTRGLPLYDKFIIAAQNIADTVSMITPVRWYSQPEKAYERVRGTMLNGQLKTIVDFQNSADCFKDAVNIAGGVCYWLWQKGRVGNTSIKTNTDEWEMDLSNNSIFIRDKVACNVVSKIDYSKGTFDTVVSGTDMFGVERKALGVQYPDAEHTIMLKHSNKFAKKYDRGIIEYININKVKKNTKYCCAPLSLTYN